MPAVVSGVRVRQKTGVESIDQKADTAVEERIGDKPKITQRKAQDGAKNIGTGDTKDYF